MYLCGDLLDINLSIIHCPILYSFLTHYDTTSNIFYIKNKISIDRQQISTTKTILSFFEEFMHSYVLLIISDIY
jgi:hypothetical protein